MIAGTLITILLIIAAQGIYRNWGKAHFDALPPHIDEPSEWIGKDHDKVWYTRWVKYVKGWFAVGPLSNYWWARWRDVPIDLFRVNDGTPWRTEWVKGKEYTSRVQYWSKWHFLVQWPLNFSFHYYWDDAAIPVFPNMPKDLDWHKLLNVYGITHFDQDRVYWLLSFFLGGTWK